MTQAPTRPVSVSELQRAWLAVRAGQFRDRRPRPAVATGHSQRWSPSEPVLAILGCHPQSGASTLAVALATAAAPARVVECSSATATGLSAASTAELGTVGRWRLGRRGRVHLSRAATVMLSLAEVPVPVDSPGPVRLNVLDVGWEIGQVVGCDSWVGETVAAAAALVLTTSATTPGLRRLENALAMLAPLEPAVAVLGPPRRRWPRHLEGCLGPLSSRAALADRLHCIPTDKALAERGLTGDDLPTSLQQAAAHFLEHTAPELDLMEGTTR